MHGGFRNREIFSTLKISRLSTVDGRQSVTKPMRIKKFEEIQAWQKAQELAITIYSEFKNSKDFGFRDQICRSVVSISSNIAEGFERSSDADFARFLYISLGSCSELKSLTYIAIKIGYINDDKSKKIISTTNEISKMIQGLIRFLNQSKK